MGALRMNEQAGWAASPTLLKTRSRPCPICQSDAGGPQTPYGGGGWHLITCGACGFPHMRDVPESSELETVIAWEVSYAAEKTRRNKAQPLLQRFDDLTRWRLHLLPRTEGVDILNRRALPGPAIDIGCGEGTNMARFAPHLVPHGVEISRHLAAVAQPVAQARGGHVLQAPAYEGLQSFPKDFFVAALLRSYLEHDWQAREVLHTLRTRMAPGGIAVIKVPNYGGLNRKIMGGRWCGFRFPDHVNQFDRQSLTRLARDAGFDVCIPFRYSLPTDDNMLAILTRPAGGT